MTKKNAEDDAASTPSRAAARRAALAGSGTQALIRLIIDNPVDQGYTHAIPRHERSLALRLLSVVVIAALTTTSVWAARDLRRTRIGTQQINAQLITQVEDRQDLQQLLTDDISTLNDQIAEQEALLAPMPQDQSDLLTSLGGVVGTLPVSGEGLVITVDHANVSSAEGRIRDFDLQVVTNALWSIGAEAVAVNEQRLTPSTALRTAGQAILVNLVPLSPPYRIEAIGNSNEMMTLIAATRAAGHLAALRDDYGVTYTVTTSSSLELPGATQTTTYSYAVPIPERSGTTLDSGGNP